MRYYTSKGIYKISITHKISLYIIDYLGMDLLVSKWPCTLEAIGTEIWQIEPTETGIFLDDFFGFYELPKV